jgi:N-acetylmuramic acid 6-phosphate (MurNAc-6-P) etherase
MKGKIFKNRMIDVGVSNNKLFERSFRIIREFAGISEQAAKECLLKATYGVDHLTTQITDAPISRHIEVAFKNHQVVPKALLLATGHFDIATATSTLSKDPVVRRVVQQHISHS